MYDINHTEYDFEIYEPRRNGLVKNFSIRENNTVYTNETSSDYESWCSASASSGDFLASPLFQACVYFMYCSVFVVALVGNGLVCFVVQTSPRMKTVTNYFIVNLAVGDILMTLFCVPFSFVSMLVLRYWPFGAIMCKVVNYSQAVSVLVSAYTLLAISIDRYMAIMRPLRPRLGKAAAKLVVAAVWGGALATAAPIPVVSTLQRPTEWYKFCQADICLEQWERVEQSSQYTCALLALQFVLPLGALMCTYARIAHAVWGGRPPGEAQSARDTRMQRSKRKMIKMMVMVVTVFTICWLPLNVFIMLWTSHESDAEWGAWPGMPYVWFASHWLAMSHSCYNPIIYCYMNARYRRGFKQALAGLLCMKLEVGHRSCHRSSMCDGMPMSAQKLNGFDLRQSCKDEWSTQATGAVLQAIDPTAKPDGFNLPRKLWCRLNILRTGHGRCYYFRHRWGWRDSALCDCGEEDQNIDHIIQRCPLHSYSGPPEDLYKLTPDALTWLGTLNVDL